MCLLCVWGGFRWLRWRAARRAGQTAVRHAERHRALWAPLLEAPGFERELGIMEEALAMKMASAVPVGASRQTDEQS